MKLKLTAILALLSIVAGCTGFRDKVFRPVVSTHEIPERRAEVVTPVESATVEEFREAVGLPLLRTNLAVTFITNYVMLPAQTVVLTNGWERRPEAQETTAAIGAAVNTFLPGYGTLATGVAGILSTAWLAWLNRKNRNAAVAVIAGVEDFREQNRRVGGPVVREDGQVVGNTATVTDERLLAALRQAKVEAGPTVAQHVTRLVADNT